MDFTQEQISLIFDEIANQKNGYQSILKLSLEAIMRAEREQFNLINPFFWAATSSLGSLLATTALPLCRPHRLYQKRPTRTRAICQCLLVRMENIPYLRA
ncbi:MAG: hypothetical protein QM530_02550 [Phycisphaerales bacterium]|nr:hypothetical protein [Phycisphaerales bacterium]